MAEDESGNKVYINAWPAKLDLEDLIYRPLILTILPFIGAFCSRICDSMVDTLAYVAKKTAFKPKSVPARIVEFAYMRKETKVQRIQREITNSLSFSLLLFCVGLCGALVYMLFVIV